MPEPLIRGHVIQHTVRYFRSECDPDLALRIEAALPLELKAQLRELVPASWYPRRFEVEILDTIARIYDDELAVRNHLIRCGASMAVGNNDFMKLLTRVLTPELFLKKLPSFWSRDHQDDAGYQLDQFDQSARSASLRLCGVRGYTHSALLWHGWIQEIFREIGAAGCEVRQQGWTWSDPAPDEIKYEVKWS
jgi:hypothetical protein